MYRQTRQVHKWIGLVLSLFFLVIASSGFVLAHKDRWEWVKPKTEKGEGDLSKSSLTLSQAAKAALAAGIPEIRTVEDIGRMEVHVGKNVVKVHSSVGYAEVQICGSTGKVLATGRRWDQLAEHVHDLRWFNISLRDWLLPWAAAGLLFLSLSGISMALTPTLRRWKNREAIRAARKPAGEGEHQGT